MVTVEAPVSPSEGCRPRTETGTTVTRSAVTCGCGVPSWSAASASASSCRNKAVTASARVFARSRPVRRPLRRPVTLTSGSGNPLPAFHIAVLATTLARYRRECVALSGVCWAPLGKEMDAGGACWPRSTTAVSGLASAEGLSSSSSALVSWADSPGRCEYIRMYHWCLP
ncbi:hypothetical protein EES45_08525 [Streptomyces sp. ADI97-07]|nr:hypothetical protein EES45_08525 [Streptomyces sp. ADI97-07]